MFDPAAGALAQGPKPGGSIDILDKATRQIPDTSKTWDTIGEGMATATAVAPIPGPGKVGLLTRFGAWLKRTLGIGKVAPKALDPNKLHHIFGKAGHNLGPLVQKFGSQEATFRAVESATQSAVKSRGLTGVFETTVSVGGQNVVVRGNVVEGVGRVGTFFIP